MSLKIAVSSTDDQGERITVHANHHDVEQLDYQPAENVAYDEDVAHMSVNEYSAH